MTTPHCICGSWESAESYGGGGHKAAAGFEEAT